MDPPNDSWRKRKRTRGKSALISRCSSGGDVAGFFQRVTPIAVDVYPFGARKKSRLSRDGFPWDDVGTWAALARVRPVDAAGNVVVGPGAPRETSNSIVWAEDGPVVLFGVISGGGAGERRGTG